MAKESLKTQGIWTVYSLSDSVKENSLVIDKLRAAARGNTQCEAELVKGGIIKEVKKVHNIVPTTGRNVLARILSGNTTYTGIINYIAVGSGDTAFDVNSTTLNTEVFRKVVSSGAYEDNVAYVDVFYAASDVADQTFKEAGAFIDGTATEDTGKAFSLVVDDFVKSGSMFLSLQVTFSQT